MISDDPDCSKIASDSKLKNNRIKSAIKPG